MLLLSRSSLALQRLQVFAGDVGGFCSSSHRGMDALIKLQSQVYKLETRGVRVQSLSREVSKRYWKCLLEDGPRGLDFIVVPPGHQFSPRFQLPRPRVELGQWVAGIPDSGPGPRVPIHASDSAMQGFVSLPVRGVFPPPTTTAITKRSRATGHRAPGQQTRR